MDTALGSGAPSPDDAPSTTPEQIGAYRLLRPLGEGGMGIVYLAEQREPVQRQVALKLVKLGMDSRAIVARFAQERQALAWMQHDGIARVYDCGTTERGQPYFVMELCDGEPLDRFADRHRLSVRQRVQLLLQVCAAIEHAHQKGVVHRDLKPGNVLVAGDGSNPRVKVIDFGLAKAITDRGEPLLLHTEAGQVLGTPGYMAPEQAGAIEAAVDTRADIYALGVMLYKLLVGGLPFRPSDLGHGGLAALARLLRDREPARPSTRLAQADDPSALAAARATTAPALLRQLRTDLDWLVKKAIEREPERRYATVGELADDLRRFLANEPLRAGPPSTTYRLRKVLRRYRGRFAAAALVLLTAIGGAVVALVYADDTARAERAAQQLAAALASKVGDYDQLAGVVLLAQARTAAAALFPGWPDRLPALQRWSRDAAAPLLAMRPQLDTTLRSLQAERSDLQPAARTFLAEALGRLRTEIDAFERLDLAAVRRAQQWAERIATASLQGPAAERWRAARVALACADGKVASTAYAGRTWPLADDDVVGLVPIGANPITGLWEFYDLRSAWEGHDDPAALATPSHRSDGSIAVDDATGIVFVLLPGGDVVLGAQRADPSAPHHDQQAQDDETPYGATLAPFFLARHELTQGQWQRLWLGAPELAQPSRYRAGQELAGRLLTAAHPVEQVDWRTADRLLRDHGLCLPSEAQWEYACRAGSSTPWQPGRNAADLAGAANVLDATGGRVVPDWGQGEAFEDCHIVHAPVGSFAANPFGLFDLHGNVFEWCRDVYAPYGALPRAAGDAVVLGAGRGDRVNRGGSFDNPAALARCSDRSQNPPEGRDGSLGLRAVRPLLRTR